MVNVEKDGRVEIHWKVSPYDYTKELQESILAKASLKYGIPKKSVKVVPEFIAIDSDGKAVDIVTEKVKDIQDPRYQIELFKDYIKEKGIEDVDFELIQKIDSEINSFIDYHVYDKYKRYSINWLRWSNFLSYGEDNYFDFKKLGKLVLLNGNPANQSGKTTFAIDLIHFLLFGKVTKYKTQDKIFNKHLTSATTVTVEGSITVDGQEYIIKRTLSRPQESRRTSKSSTTQKVEYYKIVGDQAEELQEFSDELSEESTAKTNKAIKNAIGDESDFDLVVSATESNLDELIEKKDAERGRLLTRWIGLLPLEKKDEIARAKYNSDIKPYLLSNTYNRETLNQEIESFRLMDKAIVGEIKKYEAEVLAIGKDIETLEKTRSTLISSKRNVDEKLIKLDVTTHKSKMDAMAANGKQKAEELSSVDKELSEIGGIDFSHEKYDSLCEEQSELKSRIILLREQYKNKSATLEHYKTSEYCPTCHRKLDNVDNSKMIAELTEELKILGEDGKKATKSLEKTEHDIASMKDKRALYERKNKLSVAKGAYEAAIARLREEYKELLSTYKEYKANQEAIDANNKLDLELRNTEAVLASKREAKDNVSRYILENKAKHDKYAKEISDRTLLIQKLAEEAKLIRNWKIYLEIVGKDGVSKMVLREALPLINGRLSGMLSDICDFSVCLRINNKNEVMFYLVKDDVYSDLSGASGFERTASALALRSVLGSISTIPRPNFFVADEILGRVAQENYDNMKLLLEKIGKDYDFILNITHLDDFKDFCDTQVCVTKENNVSRITLK